MEPLLTYSDFVKFYKAERFVPKNPLVMSWFPLFPSADLAGIAADLMGDGNMLGAPRWRLDFCSKSVDELLRFEKTVFELFGVNGKIRPCTTNQYGTMNYGVNCKPVTRTLHAIGIPIGEKVSQQYIIPNWVLSDKLFFVRFFQRYFDCEGCVSVKYRSLDIGLFKREDLVNSGFDFMNALRNGLDKYFEIVTSRPFLTGGVSRRKDGTISREIKIKIRRRVSIGRFKDFIKLETPHKLQNLALLSC